MHAKLAEILKEKEAEIASLKSIGPSALEVDPSADRRDFKKVISGSCGIDLIAEIKFGSPSAGTIRHGSDPFRIGTAYEANGAAAISLLTDKKFFKGDLKHLPELKERIRLPILRKDFILHDIQVRESASFGADAILLIARILSFEQLKDLLGVSRNYGIAVLTEVHDREDLEKALTCDADIIGINNRDLDTFKIDLNTTFQLAPLVPEDRLLVCESGIGSDQDIALLKGLNIDAVLVGTALMSAEDPGKEAGKLVAAGAA